MKVNQLTFTRFIAALTVLVFHGARSSYPFTEYPGKYIAIYGNTAVSYFFLLSGFIMVIAYLPVYEKGLFNPYTYWLARIARIYPLYIFALALTIGTVLWIDKTPVSGSQALLSIFLIQSWFPEYAGALNGPGWSLSVEAFFYFIFPFTLPFFAKSSLTNLGKTALILYLAIFSVIYYLLKSGFKMPFLEEFILKNPLIHLPTFFFGSVVGVCYLKFIKSDLALNRNALGYSLLFLGLVAIVLIIAINPRLEYRHNGLMAPAFIAFIVGFSFLKKEPIVEFMTLPVMIYLGEISYGIYILYHPVITILQSNDLFSIGDNLVRDLFNFGALFLLAMISYHIIEKPTKKVILGKKLLTSRLTN